MWCLTSGECLEALAADNVGKPKLGNPAAKRQHPFGSLLTVVALGVQREVSEV